jgi:hypothetical protein
VTVGCRSAGCGAGWLARLTGGQARDRSRRFPPVPGNRCCARDSGRRDLGTVSPSRSPETTNSGRAAGQIRDGTSPDAPQGPPGHALGDRTGGSLVALIEAGNAIIAPKTATPALMCRYVRMNRAPSRSPFSPKNVGDLIRGGSRGGGGHGRGCPGGRFYQRNADRRVAFVARGDQVGRVVGPRREWFDVANRVRIRSASFAAPRHARESGPKG